MQTQARRLIRAGVLLLLLALLAGLAIPLMALPRLGVAAHVNALLGGLALAVIGLVWPRLQLGPRAATAAFGLALYTFFAGPLMSLLAGIWGAGGGMFPIAAGAARGSAVQEAIINTGLVTAGIAALVLCVLLLVGLRAGAEERAQLRSW